MSFGKARPYEPDPDPDPELGPEPAADPDPDPDPASGGPAAATSSRQVSQTVSGLVVGLFVAVLAGTVVANALPRITAELGADQSAYTWVITAELLAMTATVPLWGKLSDLYSKKLLVQLSLALYVVGSLVAGFSQDVGTLIFSRVVQGVGAGGLTALTQVVMAAVIPPRQLGRYSGVFGAIFSSATVAGPLIGGVLVDTPWLGWRWCFFIGVPFALLAIVLLHRTLDLPTVRREVRIDYLGAFLITAGVSALLIWVSLAGSRFDWVSWQSAALAGGAVALLGLFPWVEARASEPIVPLRIFRNRTVALTTAASLLVGVALFGGSVFLSQFFQVATGATPTAAGLMSLPMILGSLASSALTGRLVSATGRWKRYLVGGAALMTAGLALLATIGSDTSFGLLSCYMTLLGVGAGMMTQNLVLAAQNDVPAADLGSTTSLVSFFRSMGGTLGTSVLGAVLAHHVASELAADHSTGGGTDGGDTAGHGVPDVTALPAPVRELVEHAYGAATAELFLFAAPSALLALIAVMFVREKPLKTTTGAQRLDEETAAAADSSPAPGRKAGDLVEARDLVQAGSGE